MSPHPAVAAVLHLAVAASVQELPHVLASGFRAASGTTCRLTASVRTGTVSASLLLKRLDAYPRQNGLALALREIGRIERTLHALDWLERPQLRRQATAELNKGEAATLGWQHFNLTGDYLWGADANLGPDGFRPLRGTVASLPMAAAA